MAKLHCNIVSAEEELYDGPASLVVASGEMGELGIMPQHAPLITRLKPGQVRVMLGDNEETHLFVSGGILEVQPHLVTILADTAIRAQDLDEAAALRAKQAAERTLADHRAEGRHRLARAKLAEAMAQLAVAAHLRARHRRYRR